MKIVVDLELVPLIEKCRILLLPALLLAVSGCVSSTLESSQFRPVGARSSVPESPSQVKPNSDPVALTSVEVPVANAPASAANGVEEGGVDPAARQAAIAEMRAKAEQTSGQKTIIGALPETAASQLTPAERQQKSEELAQKVREANADVTDSEVASKQASIKRLQQKAKTHYNSAINAIEN